MEQLEQRACFGHGKHKYLYLHHLLVPGSACSPQAISTWLQQQQSQQQQARQQQQQACMEPEHVHEQNRHKYLVLLPACTRCLRLQHVVVSAEAAKAVSQHGQGLARLPDDVLQTLDGYLKGTWWTIVLAS
jgi:hypothetical protein